MRMETICTDKVRRVLTYGTKNKDIKFKKSKFTTVFAVSQGIAKLI